MMVYYLAILSTRDTMDPCMDLNIADVALLEAVLSEEELVLHNINTSSLK